MNEIYKGQNRHFQFSATLKTWNFFISELNDLCLSQKIRDFVDI